MDEFKLEPQIMSTFRTVEKKNFSNFYAADKARAMAMDKYGPELDAYPRTARIRVRARPNSTFDVCVMKRVVKEENKE